MDQQSYEMPRCPVCGTITSLRFCPRCGSGLPDAVTLARIEIDQIAYLLRQLPGWRAQALLTADAEQRINRSYEARLAALRAMVAASQAPNQPTPLPQTPIPTAPQIATGSAPSDSEPPPPMDLAFAGAARPASSVKADPTFAWPRRLLHEHALKIVFALATLFVLAALHSILAWPWIDAVMVRLLPGIPLGLTAMFWWFGRKTRSENLWAAFVYDGLAVALLAFDAYAVNSYWLFGALPPKAVLLMACAASTGAAGAMLASYRSVPYLHLLHIGMFALLYALLQLLRPGSAPYDLRPLPIMLFSGCYLLYAACCLLMTRHMQGQPVQETATDTSAQPAAALSGKPFSLSGWQSAWTLWAHLAAAGAGLLASAALILQQAGRADFALLTLLAGAIYMAGAQLLSQPRMVYLSTGFLAASALFWLTGHPGWDRCAGFDLLLLAFSALALALAGFNARAAARSAVSGGLARAYRHIAETTALLATLISWVYALPLIAAAHAEPNLTRSMVGVLLAAGCGAFHLLFALRERRPASAYLTLACAGWASALLVWRLLPPTYCTLATCLLPFMLVTSGIQVFRYSGVQEKRGRGDLAPTKSRGVQPKGESHTAEPEYLTPLAQSTLLAVLIGAGDWLWRLLLGTAISHWAVWLLPCLAAALLLALARPRSQPDSLRTAAIGALCLLAALEVAALCGLPHGLPCWHWRPEPVRAFSYGLALLGWAWWLAAEGARRKGSIWSDDLATGGLITAFAAILVLTFGYSPGQRIGASGLLLFDACLAAIFALFALDSYRLRRQSTAVCALLIFALAGAASALHLSPAAALVAPLWTLYALMAAGVLLLLGRHLRDVAVARFSAGPLLIGYGLFALWQTTPALSALDATAARLLWIVGGLLLAWGWLRTALWSERSEFSYGAGALLIGCYLRAVTLLWHPSAAWHALLLLPCLIALRAVGVGGWGLGVGENRKGEKGRRGEGEPSEKSKIENRKSKINTAQHLILWPLRRTAFVFAVLALAWSTVRGDGLPVGPATPWLVTLSFGVYGLAFMVLALTDPTPANAAASSITLTAAYLHLLLEHTDLFSPQQAALSWPRFAFLAVQVSLFWLGIGWRLYLRRADLARPLLALAGGVSLLSAVVGLLTVQAPHEGFWTLLALAWGGAIWFGLWALEQGEICLHVGIWNLLIAWALALDNRYGFHLALLDLYLLPVGLYLIALGHLSSRRQNGGEARPLWWAGLLLILTPAFYATWEHFGSAHTILFVLECLAAVLWGIVGRIRAFVSAGLAFAALFAASITIGRLPDMWGALTALLVGLTLFVAGFYILTHRALVQRWAALLEHQWQVWLSWR